MLTRNFLIVLTDGGRARLVERSQTTGDFVTIETIDHMRELRRLRHQVRARPPVRTFGSFSMQRHGVGKEDPFRPAKEAFMTDVARRAARAVWRRKFDGVVVAAPPRLIGVLRRRLGRRTLVAEVVGKDLTKVSDHELAAWFGRGARFGKELRGFRG